MGVSSHNSWQPSLLDRGVGPRGHMAWNCICGARIESTGSAGRDKEFCSRACRQRYYHHKQKHGCLDSWECPELGPLRYVGGWHNLTLEGAELVAIHIDCRANTDL